LKHAEKGTDDDSGERLTMNASAERQMLFKYVTAWNQLAIAYQDQKRFSESIESFITATQIYLKLSMRVHATFAIGDLNLSRL
jgi:hypothetical protein